MPWSAAALPVSADDQAVLRRWANATQAPAVLVRRAKILLLAATLSPPAQALGVTHWSSRLLAAELGRQPQHGGPGAGRARCQPLADRDVRVLHRPALEARVRDVVGLYLDPPAHAIVLCVDEKAQIQALERTRPVRRFCDGWNQRCQPFTWTKDADQILAKLNVDPAEAGSVGG